MDLGSTLERPQAARSPIQLCEVSLSLAQAREASRTAWPQEDTRGCTKNRGGSRSAAKPRKAYVLIWKSTATLACDAPCVFTPHNVHAILVSKKELGKVAVRRGVNGHIGNIRGKRVYAPSSCVLLCGRYAQILSLTSWGGPSSTLGKNLPGAPCGDLACHRDAQGNPRYALIRPGPPLDCEA